MTKKALMKMKRKNRREKREEKVKIRYVPGECFDERVEVR